MIKTNLPPNEEERKRRIIRINLILLLALVTTVIIFHSTRDTGQAASFDLDETALTVMGPEDFRFVLPLSDIKNVEFIDLPDTGQTISGGEIDGCSYGIRQNDLWGRYTLCAVLSSRKLVVITMTDDSVYAFNLEDDEVTTAFHTSFLDYLANPT